MVLIVRARVCMKVPYFENNAQLRVRSQSSRPMAEDSRVGTPQHLKGDVVRSRAIIDSCGSPYKNEYDGRPA